MKSIFWMRIIFSGGMLIVGLSFYIVGQHIEGSIWIVGSIILSQLSNTSSQ